MCFTHSFFHFATLRKSLQTVNVRLAVCMVTDFVSFIYNLKTCFELILRKSLQTASAFICNLKNSFEQPAASFLVCSLIFIEY
ncbi:S1 RNA-binding domain-containing protein [Streptococcus pneumoniae]|nr:S1 RNA-binding domain-containing protein [Streptococcus pneumoniae]